NVARTNLDGEKCRILRRDQKVASKSKLEPAADCSAPDHRHGGNAQCLNGMERTVALGDERAEPVGALSRPLRDIASHAEIRAVRPDDEDPAVAQARVMDRGAKVHGELAADAVRRGVRQDNGPDAVILLKSDRRHFSQSSVRSGFRRRQAGSRRDGQPQWPSLSESGGHRLRSEAEDRTTYCSRQGTTWTGK